MQADKKPFQMTSFHASVYCCSVHRTNPANVYAETEKKMPLYAIALHADRQRKMEEENKLC